MRVRLDERGGADRQRFGPYVRQQAAGDERLVRPGSVDSTAGRPDRRAAVAYEARQAVDGRFRKPRDIREHDHVEPIRNERLPIPNVGVDRLDRERAGFGRFVDASFAPVGGGGGERCERDRDVVGLSFERHQGRVAIDQEHADAVEHIERAKCRVVRRVRIVAVDRDRERMRAWPVDRESKQRLSLSAARKVDTDRLRVGCAVPQSDRQIENVGVAPVADDRPDGRRLTRTDRPSRRLDLSDRDVVDRIGSRRLAACPQNVKERQIERGRGWAFGTGVPLGGLEVADDDDLPQGMRKPRHLNRGFVEHFPRVECVLPRLYRRQCTDQQRRVGRRAIEKRSVRLAGEQNDELRPGRRAEDQFFNRGRRRVEPSRFVRFAPRRHRSRIVDDDDQRDRAVAPQRLESRQQRASHEDGEQNRNENPHGEQQPLVPLQPPLVRLDHILQQVHRPPGNRLIPAAVKQMNDERHRGGRDAGEQDRVQERHACPRRARNAASESANG